MGSVNLFHLVRSLSRGGSFVLLQGGKLLLDLVVINGEAELDHAVNAGSEGGRLVKGEAGCQKGSVEQQPDQVSDRFVTPVLIGLLLELNDDGVLGVDLHGLL